MTKPRTKNRLRRTLTVFAFGLAALATVLTLLLRGNNVVLFNPKGPIAEQQHYLMLGSMLLLLSVAVPTMIFLYFFAWKYRETNQKADYKPDAPHSKLFEAGLWAIPTVFILFLALVMWPATHRLEPKKSIAADTDPITIQVVAMRWKWLFIYPEQNIATVNHVRIPVGTPIQFELTADEAPMSSFWIPQLGGQLYAMTGHVNRLNLMADTAGDYQGSSAEINGAGFAGMKFIAQATPRQEFDAWVAETQSAANALSAQSYSDLLKPTQNHPVTLYSSVDSQLYDKMLMKYAGSHDHKPTEGEYTH